MRHEGPLVHYGQVRRQSLLRAILVKRGAGWRMLFVTVPYLVMMASLLLRHRPVGAVPRERPVGTDEYYLVKS